MSETSIPVAAIPLDRRIPFRALWALTAISIGRQLRAKRIFIMAALFTVPILIAILDRYQDHAFNPLRAEFVVIYSLFPQALIPMAALLYSSGMIQDEIEDQTLTYLMIRPLPRWGIYLAKLAATCFVTALLTTTFTFLTFITINGGTEEFWTESILLRAAQTSGLFALTLLAYVSIFGGMSLVFKRTLVIGVAYIILFEGVLANIDFMVRKATVMYYFRVLAARWLDIRRSEWAITLDEAPSATESVLTLVIAAAVFTSVAATYFTIREFRVKTPEGS